MAFDPKADLHEYLRSGREAMLWKVDGLSEYDARRPLVPTGTNLLGLVRHVASIETGYFGEGARLLARIGRAYFTGDDGLLRAVARALMRNHLSHCATHAFNSGSAQDREAMYDELLDIIYKNAR